MQVVNTGTQEPIEIRQQIATAVLAHPAVTLKNFEPAFRLVGFVRRPWREAGKPGRKRVDRGG